MRITSFRNLNDYTVRQLTPPLKKSFAKEMCGVCEKTGVEVQWFNPNSRGGHQNCIKKIEQAESEMCRAIAELFKNNYFAQNKAHILAIFSVKKCFEKGETLETYLEKHGEAALKHLFDTVGLTAAKGQIPSQPFCLSPNHSLKNIAIQSKL